MMTPDTQARTEQEIALAEYERIATEMSARADAAPDADWIVVQGAARVPARAPISVRMSEPLVEALDKIAAHQDRRRTNLIQHILWEYVRNYKLPGE